MYRTHTCGELRASHVGTTVTLSGWVHRRRDHGGVIFVDMRDRYGLTQVVFDPDHHNESHKIADGIRSEFVIKVTGTVRQRPEGQANDTMATGAVEVIAHEIMILNEAKTPPFEIEKEKKVSEEVRLAYRYLDLRRERLQKNMRLRHELFQETRSYFNDHDFLEIETPILIKGTPEGSREYIVPSRVHPGQCYVLPQSPQQLKQLLMIGGMDRYYQLARCMRDEDLRGDRQPEFTQLDLEMSFVEQEEVLQFLDGWFCHVAARIVPQKRLEGVENGVIRRITWEDAVARYGSDKPDLRFDMPITDVTALAGATSFQVFQQAVAGGGVVRALRVEGFGETPRSFIDGKLLPLAKDNGAKGLAYLYVTKEGITGAIAKFFTEEEMQGFVEATGAQPGDVIFFGADNAKVVAATLGAVRSFLGEHLGLKDPTVLAVTWVVDFPMFERDVETGMLHAEHHPFTHPRHEHLELLATDPEAVRAYAYDLVINGYELGGGSIRIHEPVLQEQIFTLMGISKEDADRRFGHMLQAFSYGCPPHGGCAMGMDRLAMIFADEPNIREVIAFPKTSRAEDLMLGAPDVVDPAVLEELGVSFAEKKA